MNIPDPNAKAPRPRHQSAEDERRPDMDHPPDPPHGAATGFDRGTAAADREASSGTEPIGQHFVPSELEEPDQDPGKPKK